MLSAQLEVVTVYENLYDPIVGAYDGHGAPLTPTSQLQLTRTFKLKEAYSDLKAELVEEIGTIDDRIVQPATDARDAIAPIRKTIKKRENKRLDYEKVQDRVSKMHRKPNKTAKEDAALAKAEEELANLTEVRPNACSPLRLPAILSTNNGLALGVPDSRRPSSRNTSANYLRVFQSDLSAAHGSRPNAEPVPRTVLHHPQ